MKVSIPFNHATPLQRVGLVLLWVVFLVVMHNDSLSEVDIFELGFCTGIVFCVVVRSVDMSRQFKFEDTDTLTRL